MAKAKDIWTAAHVATLAPDAASIPAAREVLKKGGFGTVEPTDDGRGWWVVCQGMTDVYQVSVRKSGTRFACACTCPSPKVPCKHALALLLYLVEHPELRTKAEAPPPAAASDFEALLKAVFANPDDDTPRLVFADFLEENDQSERAALIRYQCEHARLRSGSRRRRELDALIEPLIEKMIERIEPMPEGMGYEFHRGFIRLRGDAAFYVDVGSLPTRFTRLFRDGWVEQITGSAYAFGFDDDSSLSLLALVGELDASGERLRDEGLVRLAAVTAEARTAGRLARIKLQKVNQKTFDQLVRAQRGEVVSLAALNAELPPERYHYGLNSPHFDLLLRSGRLSGGRVVALGGPLGDDELVTLLATDLSELRELRLDGWELSPAGMKALATGPALSHLTDLCLIGCEVEPGGVAALASGSALGRLETLWLVDCGLTDADATALAASRGFPALQRLDLDNSRMSARGVAAVLAAKHVPHLAHVNLSGLPGHPSALLPLALDAPARVQLVVEFSYLTARLGAAMNEVRVVLEPRGVVPPGLFNGLAKCAGAKRVTRFAAPNMDIGAPEVRALAAAFDPGTLSVLDLSYNPLLNGGAEAVATGFAKFRLSEVRLSECKIQTTGFAALVKSPLFATVKTWDLSENYLGKAGVAAFLKVDVPANLKSLVLTGCRLYDNQAKQLKEKYGSRVKV
jgi:uncharacterized protein (TIGR02996 family)